MKKVRLILIALLMAGATSCADESGEIFDEVSSDITLNNGGNGNGEDEDDPIPPGCGC